MERRHRAARGREPFASRGFARRGAIAVAASLIALAAAGHAPRAEAQTPEQLEQARTLFREGLALSAASNFAAALAKFQAVAQVKMTAQVAFNIAECQERLGKLVAALGNYRLALQSATETGASEVVREAPGRITSLEERIPKLTIERGARAEAAVIALDGVEIGAAQIGVPIPVDPGPHAVTALVGGKEVARETITLDEAASESVRIAVPAAASADAPVDDAPQAGERAPRDGGSSKTPGMVVASLGAVSLGVGVTMLALRQGTIGELDALCGGDTSCPASAQAEGRAIVARGRIYTGVAEVTIPLGVIGVVTGVVLLATSGSKASEPATAVRARGARAASDQGVRVRAIAPFAGVAEERGAALGLVARTGATAAQSAGLGGLVVSGSF